VLAAVRQSQEKKIALAGEMVPARAICLLGRRKNEALDSFEEPSDANEDDSANESNDDRTEQTSGRPNTQTAEKPSTKYAAKDAEDDVDEDAIATTLHDEACEPAGNQTNNDPIDHALPPLSKRRFDW
jgi:hypothetical protein